MSSSATFYRNIYLKSLEAEAEWLQLGAPAKANNIEQLSFRLPKPIATYCEMGCGTGAVLEEAMRRGVARHYYGVDSSLEALEWMRKRHGDNVSLTQHDLETGAPEFGVVFDLVVLPHVLEHLANPHALLADLRAKCRCLVAEVPLENQPLPRAKAWLKSNLFVKARQENSAGHVQFFSRSSFQKLLKHSGWTILAEHTYVPYQKEAIAFASRRTGAPLWEGFAPYLLSKLMGPRVAASLLCVHHAILATAP